MIELLSVVALCAVLAALIIPSAQKALRMADNGKCISNLRQIGAGLHAYMADFNGEYPPNRYNDRYTEETGRSPFPSEVLNGTVPSNGTAYVPFAGLGSANLRTRKDAGPWFCPRDTERPVSLSASSYGYNIYLGRDDRTNGSAGIWQPWWSKPAGHERSSRLVYLIDHNLLRDPLSTAGVFSEKSWPIAAGAKPGPKSGESIVDFDRHSSHANALLVDGSVRRLTVLDLTGTADRK
ncbi:MAG TPA: DUF1559 domain-containing protein, partial [Terrimicrobiaceae bacterium]|nr:DUF1559 domain-containing protein [Terrimicrobiaceae bacterium]